MYPVYECSILFALYAHALLASFCHRLFGAAPRGARKWCVASQFPVVTYGIVTSACVADRLSSAGAVWRRDPGARARAHLGTSCGREIPRRRETPRRGAAPSRSRAARGIASRRSPSCLVLMERKIQADTNLEVTFSLRPVSTVHGCPRASSTQKFVQYFPERQCRSVCWARSRGTA